MKYPKFLGALFLVAGLAACSGEQVTIQSGEVGKQLTGQGLEKEVRQPSSMRLDYCSASAACARIVRLQVARTNADVKIDSLLLPKSNVPITNIAVGVQFRVRQNKAAIDRVFTEVTPQPVQGKSVELLISSVDVWNTFGKRKVQGAIADAFNDLTIDQAIALGGELNTFIKARVDAALADTPIEATELDVSNTDPTEEVLKAKSALFAIEDNKSRRIKELQVNQALEAQRQAFQVLRATNDAAIAKTIGISPAQYMCLKTMERLADAADDNKSTVVINGACGLEHTTNTVVPFKQ